MTLYVKTNHLKEAVTGFNKIVVGKPSLPVLSFIKVSQSEEQIHLTGTNLDETLSYHINTKEEVFDDFLIPLADLKKMLKSKGLGDEISFQLQNDKLLLSANIYGSVVREELSTMPVDHFPQLGDLPKGEGCTFRKEYFNKLRNAYACTSADDSREALHGVLLKDDSLVSTNGKLLFVQNIEVDIEHQMIIPANKVFLSCLFKDDSVLYADVENKHIVLKSEKWEYVFNRINNIYPNYKNVIPQVTNQDWQIEFDAKSLNGLLAQILHLESMDGQEDIIAMYADEDNVLILDGEPSDTITALKASAKFSGYEEIGIAIDKEYLSIALRNGYNKMIFADKSRTAFAPITFCNDTTDDIIVLMPFKAVDGYCEELINRCKKQNKINKEDKVMQENNQNQWPVNATKKTEEEVSVPNIKQPIQEKVNANIKEQEPKASSFEDLLIANDEMKVLAKELLDKVIANAKDIREAQKEYKGKDKIFSSMKKTFAQFNKASGF